jgi:hypothetical protein
MVVVIPNIELVGVVVEGVVVEGTKLVVIVVITVIVPTMTVPLTVSCVEVDSTMILKSGEFPLNEVTVLPLGRLFDDKAG